MLVALLGGAGLVLAAVLVAVVLRLQRKQAWLRSSAPFSRLRCVDVCCKPGDAIEPDVTCAVALRLLITSGRRCAPVCVRRKFIGMLTLTDFAKLGERNPAFVYVAAIMTPVEELMALQPGASGAEAYHRLYESGHHQLPVVSKNGSLLGFVSRASLRRSKPERRPRIRAREIRPIIR